VPPRPDSVGWPVICARTWAQCVQLAAASRHANPGLRALCESYEAVAVSDSVSWRFGNRRNMKDACGSVHGDLPARNVVRIRGGVWSRSICIEFDPTPSAWIEPVAEESAFLFVWISRARHGLRLQAAGVSCGIY
jgi:hypothetical protein